MSVLLPSRLVQYPSKVAVKALESDLVDFHYRRMIDLVADLQHRIHDEERRAAPDESLLAELKRKKAHANLNMFSTAITVREILDPMRAALGMPPFAGESRPEVE